MKKLNTAPLSGTQELLPRTQAVFDALKEKISATYRRYGYLHIETPAIDRLEVLLAKAGGDTEKQIYKLVKTAETSTDADQALRFDHTVPLARYIVEHENHLAFPLKVYQIDRNWRGERAQKGRFREFYQCDVDVIGRKGLSLGYDADVIATLLDAFAQFELDTPVLARISNRKLLAGLLEALGLARQAKAIYSIVDHAEKITPDEVRLALEEQGLDQAQQVKLQQFMAIQGPLEAATRQLQALEIENPIFTTGVEELTEVMQRLAQMGLAGKISMDLKIVRGLDYYTGTVFEFCLPEYRQVGSVCGGGRYDQLASHFTEQHFEGVGGSIGLNRLFYVLSEHNLLKSQETSPLDFTVIPISEAETAYALEVAQELRTQGHSAALVYLDKRLGERLAYAAKISQNAIVIGENEAKNRAYEIKHFA